MSQAKRFSFCTGIQVTPVEGISVVSGTVKNLVVSKSYENMLFTPTTRDITGVGAIAAAAVGEGLGASVLAGASQGAEIPMEYFTCNVGAKKVYGRFFKVEFNNDEHIDFVVQRQNTENEAYAARDPFKRIVWTLPLQCKGHTAQLKSNIKCSVTTTVCLTILSMILVFYAEDRKISSMDTVLKVGAAVFAFTAFLSYRICSKFFQNGRDVTAILDELGFADAASVDLSKKNSAAEKRYATETGTMPLAFENCRFRYDSSALTDRAAECVR